VEYHLDKSDWYAKFPNGSEIWFGGLDDAERADKILGFEFATLFFNECSQISQAAVHTALTRLAQLCTVDHTGKPLRLKAFYDCNPTKKSHWTYKQFVTQEGAYLLMNPGDNTINLPEDYLAQLATLPKAMRDRFLLGVFVDEVSGSLWSEDLIDKWRVSPTLLPEFKRVVVAVDPSGAREVDEDTGKRDATGIVAMGLSYDGVAYVLSDTTLCGAPIRWGEEVVRQYHGQRADVVVAEVNYGGDMVRHVLHSIDPSVKFQAVTATRGKAVRAQPISALTENGKIRFAGMFPELEEELCNFTPEKYGGRVSPNRADAFIWAASALFPALGGSTLGIWEKLGQ